MSCAMKVRAVAHTNYVMMYTCHVRCSPTEVFIIVIVEKVVVLEHNDSF